MSRAMLHFFFFLSTCFALGFILDSEYLKICNSQTSLREFLYYSGDRPNILRVR